MSNLRPIWTPAMARETAADARNHPTERGVSVEVVGARPRTLRRLAICAVVGAAVAGFALGTATNAHADTSADLARYGDAICATLAAYPNANGIAGIGAGLLRAGFSAETATNLIFLAAATECPSQLAWLNDFQAPTEGVDEGMSTTAQRCILNMTAERCRRCNLLWSSNAGPREGFSVITKFCPTCVARLPRLGLAVIR